MAMSCVCEGMVNGQMVGSLSAELCSPERLEVQRVVNAVLRREHSPGFTWPSRDFFAPYFPFKPKKSKLFETSIDCEELGVKSLFSLSVPRPLCLSLCVCVCRTPWEVVNLAPLTGCIGKEKCYCCANNGQAVKRRCSHNRSMLSCSKDSCVNNVTLPAW